MLFNEGVVVVPLSGDVWWQLFDMKPH